MKAPRLHELTARVVAWHNRHPLAQRIDASQVHSIGEVLLPFASAQPWGGAPPAAVADATPQPQPPPPPAGPTLAEALAQRTARLQPVAAGPAQAIDGLDVQSMLPEDDAALFDPPAAAPPAATAAAEDADIDLALDAPAPDAAPAAADSTGADGETALVIPLLDGDAQPPAADSAADAAPDDTAADTAPPSLDDAAASLAQADTPAQDGDADSHADAATLQGLEAAFAAPGPAAVAAPAGMDSASLPVVHDAVYPPPHGNVPESALARAVARRAEAQGQATAGHHGPSWADADGASPPAGRWRRLVAALRQAFTGRQPGLPPLRAAFSREFIWPLRPGRVARWAQRHGRPQPLAPADWPRRSIDRDAARLAGLRQKGLAHDLPLHVLTAAIGVGDRRIRVLVGADGSVLGPRAYSRARLGSASLVLAVGLVALGWTLRPLHGGPDDGAAAVLAAAPASAASAPVAAASATAPLPDAAASATALAHAAGAADSPASAAPAALAAASAADAASAPATLAAATPEAEASAPQASIRPVLSDEERYAARVEAARLRGEPPPAPPATLLPGPVYAVVSPASRQRAAAAGNLAQMKSAASRLDGPVPEHGELLESQGQWRAAWWPFTSLVDAERARVLLAGRGIKAEVVEF
jgi:hypothetical protein